MSGGYRIRFLVYRQIIVPVFRDAVFRNLPRPLDAIELAVQFACPFPVAGYRSDTREDNWDTRV